MFVALDPDELHHGGCEGVDWSAHLIGRGLWHKAGKPHIFVHPASGPAAKWTHQGILIEMPGVTILSAKPPLIRDRDIADATEVLLALPAGPEKNNPRSGTWYTIRYARRADRMVKICLPDDDFTIDLTGHEAARQAYVKFSTEAISDDLPLTPIPESVQGRITRVEGMLNEWIGGHGDYE